MIGQVNSGIIISCIGNSQWCFYNTLSQNSVKSTESWLVDIAKWWERILNINLPHGMSIHGRLIHFKLSKQLKFQGASQGEGLSVGLLHLICSFQLFLLKVSIYLHDCNIGKCISLYEMHFPILQFSSKWIFITWDDSFCAKMVFITSKQKS